MTGQVGVLREQMVSTLAFQTAEPDEDQQMPQGFNAPMIRHMRLQGGM